MKLEDELAELQNCIRPLFVIRACMCGNPGDSDPELAYTLAKRLHLSPRKRGFQAQHRPARGRHQLQPGQTGFGSDLLVGGEEKYHALSRIYPPLLECLTGKQTNQNTALHIEDPRTVGFSLLDLEGARSQGSRGPYGVQMPENQDRRLRGGVIPSGFQSVTSDGMFHDLDRSATDAEFIRKEASQTIDAGLVEGVRLQLDQLLQQREGRLQLRSEVLDQVRGIFQCHAQIRLCFHHKDAKTQRVAKEP